MLANRDSHNIAQAGRRRCVVVDGFDSPRNHGAISLERQVAFKVLAPRRDSNNVTQAGRGRQPVTPPLHHPAVALEC